jgi:hypothetical protein
MKRTIILTTLGTLAVGGVALASISSEDASNYEHQCTEVNINEESEDYCPSPSLSPSVSPSSNPSVSPSSMPSPSVSPTPNMSGEPAPTPPFRTLPEVGGHARLNQ